MLGRVHIECDVICSHVEIIANDNGKMQIDPWSNVMASSVSSKKTLCTVPRQLLMLDVDT